MINKYMLEFKGGEINGNNRRINSGSSNRD